MKRTIATLLALTFLPAAAAAAEAPTKGNPRWTGAPIVGIWAGFKDVSDVDFNAVTGSFEFKLSKTQMRWRTFLGDGSCLVDLPIGGLISLNVDVAKADKNTGGFWGTWSAKGEKASCKQSTRQEDYRLSGDELVDDPVTTGHTKYYRVKSVDGLALDGKYSSWQMWEDSQRASNWQSIPVIVFTRDGHFDDRGAFMGNPTDALNGSGDRHPGHGTYEIRGYTLVLRYEDGREVPHTFTGPMKKDPAKDASVVFIEKFPFYRR